MNTFTLIDGLGNNLLTSGGFLLEAIPDGQLYVSVRNNIPSEILTEPYSIVGTCTEGALVTLTSNTGASFTTVQYDRTKQPLNEWSCEVSDMETGPNIITITCSL